MQKNNSIFECPACFNQIGINEKSEHCSACGCYFSTPREVVDVQPCFSSGGHSEDDNDVEQIFGIKINNSEWITTGNNKNNNAGGTMPKASITDYKGNPVISLPLDDKGMTCFKFGFKKAQAILEYLDEIKNFVAKEEHLRSKKRKGLEDI